MSDPGEAPRESPTNNKDLSTRSKQAKKRFLESMEINYEKWHDGIGHDLTAVNEITQEDKDSIVDMLSVKLDEPWRTFETLEHIKTPKAIATINHALSHPSLEVRIAATRFAKGADVDRERILIEALEITDLYAGLSQALYEVDGRKLVTDVMPQLSSDLIDKLLEKRALLKGNSVDGFAVDENWKNEVKKDPGNP